jgi:hypothetical protein
MIAIAMKKIAVAPPAAPARARAPARDHQRPIPCTANAGTESRISTSLGRSVVQETSYQERRSCSWPRLGTLG